MKPDVKAKKTSWEPIGGWYNDLVGDKGHYYHRQVVIPGILKLLDIKDSKENAVLDVACGQGVLARHLPKNVFYTGIDISPALIKAAKSANTFKNHEFTVGDATKSLGIKDKEYTHGTIVLALQNIEFPDKALINIGKLLKSGAKFVIVLNHPCFRIPRQSSWGTDERQKLQYRRIDRYLSDMKIPIQANPSKKEQSQETWSFHHPLSSYSRWLKEAGFTIELIEEWCSDKVSTGKNAKMENRSREEIPLFMAILAKKL